jgi:hypothetical protein
MATQAITMAMHGMRQHVKDRDESLEGLNARLYALQQRARRGPTPEVFYAKHLDNTRLVTEGDPERAKEMRRFGIAMVALFLLVMVYVVQHFQSIEYGYRIEAQKQTMADLSEKNRELKLQEAELNAPLRLDSYAQKLGMDAPSPSQIVRPDALADSSPVLAKATLPANAKLIQ